MASSMTGIPGAGGPSGCGPPVQDGLRLDAEELAGMSDRILEVAVEGLGEAAGRLLVLAGEARRIRGDR